MPARMLSALPEARVAVLDPAATGLTLSVFLPLSALREAVALMDAQGYFLEDVTGLHVAEGFELDYYFAHFRRADRHRRKVAELDDARRREEETMPDVESQLDHIEDDVLRLIFLSCHPALTPESRAALTLRLVGGLTTAEIARCRSRCCAEARCASNAAASAM